MAKGERAVVLLSGGLDSTTCLAWALSEGFRVQALSVDYGQRHKIELERARAIAEKLAVPHRVVSIDLRAIGGSALTSDAIAVPRDRQLSRAPKQQIPVTYVPARNTIMLSLALGLAEVEGARVLVIGANAVDYSGYPDCRPEFMRAFENLAQLATKAGVEGAKFRVEAPLIKLSKAEIVRMAVKLGAPIDLTISCYAAGADGQSCGHCDSCVLRLKGFKEAGVADPVAYAS